MPTNVPVFFLPGTTRCLFSLAFAVSEQFRQLPQNTIWGDCNVFLGAWFFGFVPLVHTFPRLLATHFDPLTPSSTTLPLPRSLPNLGQTPCQWSAFLASLNPCAHDAVYLDPQSPMLALFMFSHIPLPSLSITSGSKQSPHRSCFVSSWAVLSQFPASQRRSRDVTIPVSLRPDPSSLENSFRVCSGFWFLFLVFISPVETG